MVKRVRLFFACLNTMHFEGFEGRHAAVIKEVKEFSVEILETTLTRLSYIES
jgi:hypothetical protein